MSPDDEKQMRDAMAKAFGIDPADVDLTGLDEAAATGAQHDGDVDAEEQALARKRAAAG